MGKISQHKSKCSLPVYWLSIWKMKELWAGNDKLHNQQFSFHRCECLTVFHLKIVDEFGRYQWTQCFYHMLPAFLGGVHMLSQVEVGATPKHRLFVTPVLCPSVSTVTRLTLKNKRSLVSGVWRWTIRLSSTKDRVITSMRTTRLCPARNGTTIAVITDRPS